MQLFSVPSEFGNLEKNQGCGKAPPLVLQGKKFEEISLVKGNFEETDEKICERAEKALEKGAALFVGGDHSISYALVKAFSEKFKGKRALVVFDAHPDCVQFFKPLSHEDWVQGIVEEKMVEAGSVMLLGVRKQHELEREWMKKKGVKVLSAMEVKSKAKQAMEKLLQIIALHENIYVSVDIDAFDPGIAPGTGYTEPNGLLWQEFEPLLDALLQSGKVKAMDLVEVNPEKDVKGKTLGLAREIVEKALENE